MGARFPPDLPSGRAGPALPIASRVVDIAAAAKETVIMLWYVLTLAGIVVLLLAVAAVSDLRGRRRGKSPKSAGRIWRPIRETQRDIHAYRAFSRTVRGPGTDWMDHRRRR
ncbi:hypothetical protein GCM10023195_81470 [Actinoallomurus liliacearum]|uniref:Uncharacterized protein n=1 Tax=Actinoallomurus liliacearum TaxID=1080073 RepID=A0ABP8TZD8_9ACTN